mmetsp:Transcript_71457/g.190026  ORF Transcript_71457/g.190026 Transcript_71457/m.190026 type:complete len:223 (-) Transcript_71457:983-1651(-)
MCLQLQGREPVAKPWHRVPPPPLFLVRGQSDAQPPQAFGDGLEGRASARSRLRGAGCGPSTRSGRAERLLACLLADAEGVLALQHTDAVYGIRQRQFGSRPACASGRSWTRAATAAARGVVQAVRRRGPGGARRLSGVGHGAVLGPWRGAAPVLRDAPPVQCRHSGSSSPAWSRCERGERPGPDAPLNPRIHILGIRRVAGVPMLYGFLARRGDGAGRREPL